MDEDRIRRGADDAPLKRAIDFGDVHSDRNLPDLLEQRIVSRVGSDLNVLEVGKRPDRLLREDIEAGLRRSPADDAKLEQFAVDSRCSPKWALDAHVANKLATVLHG